VNDPEILPQQRRENPEPREQSFPVPWALLVMTGALVLVGATYIAQADIESPILWGDGRARAELAGPGRAGAGAAAAVDGAALYASLCAACHQPTGAGLPGVFPPLAASEWVLGDEKTVAAIVLHGVSGTLTVKGSAYDGVMPSFKEQLGDAQLAAVLSHIRSRWGNGATAVSAETVAAVRETHKARSAPFAGDRELAALR